jgi:hypothetical protein
MNEFSVMTDIESLDTTETAVILETGAVKFNAEGLGDTFYRRVVWNNQPGRTIDITGLQ